MKIFDPTLKKAVRGTCKFFAFQNFKGAVLTKIVHALTPQPRGASSAKVSSGYTP